MCSPMIRCVVMYAKPLALSHGLQIDRPDRLCTCEPYTEPLSRARHAMEHSESP